MRFVGICKFATLHRTIPTSAWGRLLARPLLVCPFYGKAATPVVHLIQSRTTTASVKRLSRDTQRPDTAPPEPEPEPEQGAQEKSQGEKLDQMAKSKAKKKAKAHKQAVASTPTGAFIRGDSNAKVAKSHPKKKKKMNVAAAMASKMNAKSSAKPRGPSSKDSVLLEPAQPYPAPAWNKSMSPTSMGGFHLHQNEFPVDASIPFPGLNPPMGFNPLAPSFSQQPPDTFIREPHVTKRSGRQPPTDQKLMAMSSRSLHLNSASQSPWEPPRGPRAQEARGHGGSHQKPIPMTNDGILKKYGKRDQQKRILVPSAESGGVPNPTQEYLKLASDLPVRLPSPKPILIVLDLNGTLLFRPSKNPKAFVARPHALTFLNYLLSRFWVAVWSSAQPGNVGAMIDNLIADKAQRDRLVVIWGRDRFGLSSHDYAQRVQVYKRLTRLWIDPTVAASHPGIARGERWDQTNTILVDDSIEKARSEPHNLVCVPEFVGNLHEAPEVLPQVHDYLNELSFQRDVSSYMRATPFVMQ